MITNFKKIENKNTSVSFIPDNLIKYYENKVELYMLPFIRDDIKNFFNLFLLRCNIHFYCIECSSINKYDNYSTILYKNKEHKGIIRGYGLGINRHKTPETLNLTLTLNKIRHNHLVDTSKPITIYNDLPNNVLKIIDEINLIDNTNKYNL